MASRFVGRVGTVAAAFVAVASTTVACGHDRGFEASEAVGFQTASDGGTAPRGACISDRIDARTVPLAMMMLVDRSGSMLGDKWTAATKAIRAFADRGEVAGMPLGLSLFPPTGSGDECARSTYATLPVPVAELPANALVVQQALAMTAPGGDTPMSAALQGAVDAMRSYLASAEPHEGVVILVTDGDPSSCGGVDTVAEVAAAGANPPSADAPVRTFTVGMEGATFANLDHIAKAGGTPAAYDVGTGTAQQDQLLAALEAVQKSAIGCSFVLPLPSASQGSLDLASVSVEFTAGPNEPKTVVRRVDGAAACGPSTGGFYYDDPAHPTRVMLCPASCTDVRAAGTLASVQLVFGCIQRPL